MTVLPLHLGALHPLELALTLLLAFGPFLVLAVVIAVRRRRDAREDTLEDALDNAPDGAPDGAVRDAPVMERSQRER